MVSFQGNEDWSPWVAVYDPLRLELEYLRQELGRRTITLCPPCIEDLRSTGAARVAAQSTPRLFAE